MNIPGKELARVKKLFKLRRYEGSRDELEYKLIFNAGGWDAADARIFLRELEERIEHQGLAQPVTLKEWAEFVRYVLERHLLGVREELVGNFILRAGSMSLTQVERSFVHHGLERYEDMQFIYETEHGYTVRRGEVLKATDSYIRLQTPKGPRNFSLERIERISHKPVPIRSADSAKPDRMVSIVVRRKAFKRAELIFDSWTVGMEKDHA